MPGRDAHFLVDETTRAGTVRLPVILKDGSVRYKPFLGFATKDATRSSWTHPVKLLAVNYSVALGWKPVWREVPGGMAVQGSFDGKGVQIIIENGQPRFVPSTFAFKTAAD